MIHSIIKFFAVSGFVVSIYLSHFPGELQGSSCLHQSSLLISEIKVHLTFFCVERSQDVRALALILMLRYLSFQVMLGEECLISTSFRWTLNVEELLSQ